MVTGCIDRTNSDFLKELIEAVWVRGDGLGDYGFLPKP